MNFLRSVLKRATGFVGFRLRLGSDSARHLGTCLSLIWGADASIQNADALWFRHLDSPTEIRHALLYLTKI